MTGLEFGDTMGCAGKETRSMVEWRVYGCGSPSSIRSLQSSYEVVEGETRLQIDFGNGALYRRCCIEKEIEAALNPIRHLVISHCHPDHMAELMRLYVAYKYTPEYIPKQKVTLYGTQTTLAGVQQMLDHVRLEGSFVDIFTPREIVPDRPFSVGSLTVTPFPTHHIEGTVGLRIQTASGKQIVYTSDTGFQEDLYTKLKSADLLVSECSFTDRVTPYHLTLRQVAQIVNTVQPAAILLIHFYPDMERMSIEAIQAVIRPSGSHTVHVAQDGLVLEADPTSAQWNTRRMF